LLWKGHKGIVILACKDIVSSDELQHLLDFSVYPDKKDVWKSCASKFNKQVWLTKDCPPPPPVHHYVPWAVLAVEAYTRWTLSSPRESALKYFGIMSHFLADLIIEPFRFEEGTLDELVDADWQYRDFSEPLSDLAWSLSQSGVAVKEIDLRKKCVHRCFGFIVDGIPDSMSAFGRYLRRKFVRTGDVEGTVLALAGALRWLCQRKFGGWKHWATFKL